MQERDLEKDEIWSVLAHVFSRKLYMSYAIYHALIHMCLMLKQTSTGDTLVSSQKSANSAAKSFQNSSAEGSSDVAVLPVLAGMDIPDPVFFCSIEPPSLAYQKAFDHALDCLVREDPSLSVTFDSDTGQTILGGMGELHLEVVKDRILKVCATAHL